MKTTHHLLALAVAATLVGGCATQQQTETAIGAGAGAGIGAVLGTMIGGSGKGTTVGAAVGAGVGAAAGYNWPLVKEKLGMATKDSGVAVTEQADGSLKLSVPGSVSFASGSAAIDGKLYPTLDKLANTLNEYPASTITVLGYTDSEGGTQNNIDLSNSRAMAVADYLAQRGVQRSRMTINGRGEADPIADNATEMGRSQNRRVEMVIRPAQS